MGTVKLIANHRLTIKEPHIPALIEVLEYHRTQFGLESDVGEVLKSLRKLQFNIQEGNKQPDYVAAPAGSKKTVTLESLGGMDSDTNSTESFNSGIVRNNSPDMSDAQAAQLDWLIMHPEVDSNKPPALKEFMKGGKYYNGNENQQAGNSSAGSDSTGSDGNSDVDIGMADDIGTDCFLEIGSEDKDIALHAALFDKL